MMHLEELLEQWREKSGLRQSEISRRMGISRQGLYKLQKNADKAESRTLAKYAKACGVKKIVINLDDDFRSGEKPPSVFPHQRERA